VGGGDGVPPEEVVKGKLFATLSYACNFVGAPFWIVPLVMRDNAFSLYHAKQNLVLFLFTLAGMLVSIPLMFVCVGYVTAMAIWVLDIVLIILGLINVSNNQMKPLPVIGGLAESWFRGMTVQRRQTGGTP
jgi:uncharacterized membrane protein